MIEAKPIFLKKEDKNEITAHGVQVTNSQGLRIKIIESKDGGFRITKSIDSGEDIINITPRAVNQIEIK